MECLWFSRGRSLDIRLSIPDYCRTKPGSFHFLCTGRTGPQGVSTFSDRGWISCRFTGQYTTESQKVKEGEGAPSLFIDPLQQRQPLGEKGLCFGGGATSICHRCCAPVSAPVRRGRLSMATTSCMVNCRVSAAGTSGSGGSGSSHTKGGSSCTATVRRVHSSVSKRGSGGAVRLHLQAAV